MLVIVSLFLLFLSVAGKFRKKRIGVKTNAKLFGLVR